MAADNTLADGDEPLAPLIRYIVKDGMVYSVVESQKTVYVRAANAADEISLDLSGLAYVSSDKMAFHGETLTYEEYERSEGASHRFLFRDDELAAIIAWQPPLSVSLGTEMTILTLDQDVPDSAFAIPAGYRQLEGDPTDGG